jgi:hypothetical protein
MTAEAVAAAALDGIEHDRLLVMPAPGSDAVVRDPIEAVLRA